MTYKYRERYDEVTAREANQDVVTREVELRHCLALADGDVAEDLEALDIDAQQAVGACRHPDADTVLVDRQARVILFAQVLLNVGSE